MESSEARIAALEQSLREANARAERLVVREHVLAMAEDLPDHVRRTEALYEASQAFAEQVSNPTALLDTVARTCSRVVGDFTTITLIREDGSTMEQSTVHHPDPEIQREYNALTRVAPVRLGEGVMGRILLNDQGQLLPIVNPEDMAARAPEAFKAVARKLNVCSFVGVPMHVRGRVIGGVSMARSRPGNAYTVDDLAFLQDLADRAALAYENARLFTGLEERVSQATAQLRSVNQELEAFSYSVAHDLRAPLRRIDGFSHAILEDCADALNDVGRRHFSRITESVARMGQLIDDLLRMSRLARAELTRERVDLSGLANGILAQLRESNPTRQVISVVQPGLVANADTKLVEIALTNLLSNAWKFTSKKATANIEVSASSEPQGTVFVVRDDGAGFDGAQAKRLFGAFQRLHSDEQFDGTGVGLAMVQRIVHRHGGSIWAEAKVDGGATFHFTLESNAARGR